jgi:hypothetical protein
MVQDLDGAYVSRRMRVSMGKQRYSCDSRHAGHGRRCRAKDACVFF